MVDYLKHSELKEWHTNGEAIRRGYAVLEATGGGGGTGGKGRRGGEGVSGFAGTRNLLHEESEKGIQDVEKEARHGAGWGRDGGGRGERGRERCVVMSVF